MSGLREQWQSDVAHQAAIPEYRLDWPSALQQLRSNNLKLRQARLDVTNATEAVRQIFKDLIPTLNLRAGINKNITDLAGTTLDDMTFSADSFFNVPGLVGLAARLYGARLMLMRAETASALLEREQVIELYKLFLRAQEAQTELVHLDVERRTADAIREVDPFTGQVMLTEIELRELASERETQSLQQRASDLLGNYEYRWKFETNGLPDLPYAEAPLPLADTNRVAQLQMRWTAIEFEAAHAQMRGIKLRYWPELNLFISGPPIYQRAFGRERFWDADELRASADLFWYIDTRGHVSRQLRQAKRQHVLQKERLEQQSIALIDRLLHTQTLIQATRAKAEQIDQHLAILQAVPPAQNFASLQNYADEYRALVEQQRQLRRELAELETLFWFVDEYAWSQPQPLLSAADARLNAHEIKP